MSAGLSLKARTVAEGAAFAERLSVAERTALAEVAAVRTLEAVIAVRAVKARTIPKGLSVAEGAALAEIAAIRTIGAVEAIKTVKAVGTSAAVAVLAIKGAARTLVLPGLVIHSHFLCISLKIKIGLPPCLSGAGHASGRNPLVKINVCRRSQSEKVSRFVALSNVERHGRMDAVAPEKNHLRGRKAGSVF